MRTFCINGCPLLCALRPSSAPELLPLLPVLVELLLVPIPSDCCNAPKGEVPPVGDEPRVAKLLAEPDEEEEEEEFAFSDRRSAALELALKPEPGASWLS